MKITHKKLLKNPSLIALVVALLVIGSYFYIAHANNYWPFGKFISTNDGGGSTSAATQAINDQHKEDLIEKEDSTEKADDTSNGSTTASNTTVIITDAAQYDDTIEVRSYIPDHYEDGTCTITFTQDSKVVTKQTPAYRDATTTICTNPLIKRSEFPSPGTWIVKITYESSGASGESKAQNISIR